MKIDRTDPMRGYFAVLIDDKPAKIPIEADEDKGTVTCYSNFATNRSEVILHGNVKIIPILTREEFVTKFGEAMAVKYGYDRPDLEIDREKFLAQKAQNGDKMKDESILFKNYLHDVILLLGGDSDIADMIYCDSISLNQGRLLREYCIALIEKNKEASRRIDECFEKTKEIYCTK